MSSSAKLKVIDGGKPGIRPVEYRVLIELDPIEERTKGGIIMPDATKERQQMATVRGTVVAIGDRAFEDWPEALQVGDRVLTKKYAGEVAKGSDDAEYRLVQDKEILGVLE